MPSSKNQTKKTATKTAAKTPTKAAGRTAPVARTAAAQERLDQIVSAAVKVINESGLTGFSLPAVAAEVGISHVGVLHYVGSKNGLLLEVVKRVYDKAERQTGYVASFRPGGSREGERPNLPEYCRIVIEENNDRPELVLLFHTLNNDSHLPESPLHDYFADRTRNMLDRDEELRWDVPEGVDAAVAYSCALAAMYGLEGRWLSRPDEVDLLAEWARFEDFLFPLPQWEGCR
ncbi:MAG: TetR/AcrR family transcriptional regulator [Coriobacteriia bacterium]|nr:TetR/AcrR family transcriptional regulator [Coriobacteriia bacterium]